MNDVVTSFDESRRQMYLDHSWPGRNSASDKPRYEIIEGLGSITVIVDLHGVLPDTIKVFARPDYMILEAKKVEGGKLLEFISRIPRIDVSSLSYEYSNDGLRITADKLDA